MEGSLGYPPRRPLLALVALVASACTQPGLTSVAEGPRMHLRWSISWNGQPSTCAAAGVATVALRDSSGRDFGAWDCAPGEGTTPPWARTAHDMTYEGFQLLARDAKGVTLAVSGPVPLPVVTGGVVEEPPMELRVTDEPLPEMRDLFERVARYYVAHGALPMSAALTPFPVGLCCGNSTWACSGDREEELRWGPLWSQAPWVELGFQPSHEYRYSYGLAVTPSPPRFVIEAQADIDCDGRRYSDYRIEGTWDGAQFTGIDKVTITGAGN